MAPKPSFDKQTVQTGAVRPFYAYVGVTDLAVEAVREALTDIQAKARDFGKEISERDLSVDFDAKALREAADKAVVAVTAEAKAAPAKVQRLVESNFATVTDAYDELVTRGEGLVKRIRDQRSTQEVLKDAKTTVSKAKATRTSATKAAESATSDVRKAAKKAPAKKAAVKRSPAANKAATARSNAKATTTAAKKTAAAAADAVADAAEKIGD